MTGLLCYYLSHTNTCRAQKQTTKQLRNRKTNKNGMQIKQWL
uniref:Uncharacterized protein n=1 Tax=Anguilla anguilla TaxID=7936 RepID=A0A0E9RTJ8_ANGAN